MPCAPLSLCCRGHRQSLPGKTEGWPRQLRSCVHRRDVGMRALLMQDNATEKRFKHAHPIHATSTSPEPRWRRSHRFIPFLVDCTRPVLSEESDF
eukprot:scaffold26384_cov36-Tisochrysis_lutea.AAC.6